MIEKVKLSQIKLNPNNPRIVKDEKFKKLVQSIKDFPEMLEKRPIVVNTDMVILGGNQRFKACKEAGLKEVFIIVADWSEEKQKEFLIKDNINTGSFDISDLQENYTIDQLSNWGIDIHDEGYFQSQLNQDEIEFKSSFPITIVVDEDDYNKWCELKEQYKEDNNLKLFLKILKNANKSKA